MKLLNNNMKQVLYEIKDSANSLDNDGESNKPFPSSPGSLYQNEVKCSAFDMEMIFHSHPNKIHFHKKVVHLSSF